MTIRYSRGRDKFDAHPVVREAPSFDEFERAVLGDRARVKGKQWVAAPFRVNGDARPHRGKDEVEPRRFLCLDLDRIAGAETFTELRLRLMSYRGFGYTTASSTSDAPRCRIVLELDRDVDRAEGMRLGAALERDLRDEFGERIKLDSSTHRGEQPVYGPVIESDTFRFEGDPLEVDAWLAHAPVLEPERKGSAAVNPADDPVIVALKERNLYRRDLGGGRHAIRCPWESEHSSEDDDNSTATCYFQPHHGGYVTPGFRCLHEHCSGRGGDDLLAFLGIDWRVVKDAYGARSRPAHEPAEPPAYIEEVPPPDGAVVAPARPAAPAVIVRVSPLDWAEIKRTGKQPRRWASKPWASYDPFLFSGGGGAGKTQLAQQIGSAWAATVQIPMLGEVEAPLIVGMWACEDSKVELSNRALDIAEAFGIDLEVLAGRFHLIPRRGLDNTLFAIAHGAPVFTPLLGELEEQVNDLRINVMFLDNNAQMFGGNESDRHHVTKYVNAVFGCARHDDFAPGFIGHLAKSTGSEFSGSTAWENAVRARWYLGDRLPDEKPTEDEQPDSSVRFLCRRKANYSSRDYVRFQFRNGVLMPEQIETSGGIIDAIRQRRGRDVLLQAMRKLVAMGKTVSDAKGQNYLPKLVGEHKLNEGLTRRELEDAMRVLMNDGKLKRAEVGRYRNRDPKFGLVEVSE